MGWCRHGRRRDRRRCRARRLVAAAELADAGRRVMLLDQEPEQSLGGQAFWSLGGLFLVDTPEQRRMGVRDSHELALQDWLGSAQFDRETEDYWPRRWAEAYVEFAAGEKRAWLHATGACGSSRSSAGPSAATAAPAATATRCRASTSPGAPGPGVVEPFERRVRAAARRGRVTLALPAPRRRARGRRRRRRPACAARVLAPDDAAARRGVQPRRGRRLRAARRRP